MTDIFDTRNLGALFPHQVKKKKTKKEEDERKKNTCILEGLCIISSQPCFV